MTAAADHEVDPVDGAISALTTIAQQTRNRGASVEPVDFADAVGQILTTVAANVGGIDTLLAGRSGSWEADLVRQIVGGTGGYDDVWDLLRWRTTPIRLFLDTYDVWWSLGLEADYEAAIEEVSAAYFVPTTDEAEDKADRLLAALEAIRAADLDTYVTAYGETIRAHLAERKVTVDVIVERVDGGATPWWDTLSDELHAIARQQTPLPMTGTPPTWAAEGMDSRTEVPAEHGYLARARRDLHGEDPSS